VRTNRDLEAAWAYHDATKHSYRSVRTNPHSFDWANQPLLFKIYPALEPLSLPREVSPSGLPALPAISDTVATSEKKEAVPDLNTLARILYFSAGITRRRTYPGGEIFFRAAACTGALYEIELYVVCGDLPGLLAGVYHFGVGDFALRRLRAGDFRDVLVRATAGDPIVSHAPAIVVCTGTYWRNAWKYQARTYRHFGWDNGTLLANLLALCTAFGLPARVVCGFVDSEVNRLLDVDTQREVAFSMIPLGFSNTPPPAPPGPVAPLEFETLPLSQREVDYPLMREMHGASSLRSAEEVARWCERASVPETPRPSGKTVPLRPLVEKDLPGEPIEKVILRRGSARKFAREPIRFDQLSTMLERATRSFPADFHEPPDALLNHLYLIVNAVEGLLPGAYAFHAGPGLLECLREGEFRSTASYLGLEQELPGAASVAVFFLADLNKGLGRFGNRGYRAAQLEAGILGGKLYLAAYALRLGATGCTFYDDDVIQFFAPHSEGKSAIFLTLLGKSARRESR